MRDVKHRYCVLAGGEGCSFIQIWLFGATCDIYTGTIKCALIFVEAVTESHYSMNALDTSVGLDKI